MKIALSDEAPARNISQLFLRASVLCVTICGEGRAKATQIDGAITRLSNSSQ
jgi:hypothetical protein